MLEHRKEAISTIRLPSVLAIGFTGHRNLPDEAACRSWIFDFLREQKASASGVVYGVSSVAAGGDLLFAESCIQLEIPLRVLLPLPKEYFRKDFDDQTWSRVEKVMSCAVSIEVTGVPELHEEGYYECGIKTVQQSQVMIALWDGEPSRGMGGTEEIVTFAKSIGKPVIWFQSATGARNVFNNSALRKVLESRDPELHFLNSLPDLGVTPATDSSTELANAWFQKLDKNATSFAPQVRLLSSIPIVYTAAAAFLSGAGLQMPHAATWLGIGTVLGVTAAAIPVVLRLSDRQVLWARTRTATEVCRSVMALWATPIGEEALAPEIVPELSGMLMSLNLLKALDHSRNASSIDEFKASYHSSRISHQIAYFSRNAAKSAKEGRRFKIAEWTCTGLAVLIAVSLFLNRAELIHPHLFLQARWLTFSVSALFQVATIAGALHIINDCERRQRRYREVENWLKGWESEFTALKTWPTVFKVVTRVERALLVELLEWKSLIVNAKLPRK